MACDELRALIPERYLTVPGSDMVSLWHGGLKDIADLTHKSIRSPFDVVSAINDEVTFEVKDGFAGNVLEALTPCQYQPKPSQETSKTVRAAEAAAKYIVKYLTKGRNYQLSDAQKKKKKPKKMQEELGKQMGEKSGAKKGKSKVKGKGKAKK